MSAIDVRHLTDEKLAPGAFPADPRADFRLHIAPQVRRGIEQHAKADVTVEICGVLVGYWGADENGPYAAVTDYIRCDNASSKFAEVTFTHESWAQINKEMDTRFSDKRIVGWYHSHPDFGIFLSERDCFIQEHFFSGPGQVAFVIDPVRDTEGVFAWRNGKPTPLSHFWVGNNIRSIEAAQRHGGAEGPPGSMSPQSNPSSQAGATVAASAPGSFATMALAMLTMLLIGYYYGAWRSDWERKMIVAGAVAHFADTKLIRDGLQQEVSGVQSRLTAVRNEMEKLPEAAKELSKEERDEATKRRKFIRENLVLCDAALARIEEQYGLSDTEKAVVAEIAALKQAELRRQAEAAAKATSAKKPQAAAPNDKNAGRRAAAPPKNSQPTVSEAAPARQNGQRAE